MAVKYTFLTVYKFSRQGADEIITSFMSTRLGGFTRCTYDQARDVFELECDGEETFFSFVDLFNAYVEDEISDPLQTPKFERVETTSLDRSSGEWDSVPDSPGVPNGEYEQSQHQARFLADWTSKYKSKAFLLHLDQTTTEAIEKLTNCSLQIDADKTVIRISGFSSYAVGKVIQKLETLEEKHIFQSVHLHLVEPEKEKEFALQFLPLRKAGNQLLKTTLLPPDSPHIYELHKKVVARMLTYDDSRRAWLPLKSKAKPVCANAEASDCNSIWEYFLFRSVGFGSNTLEHLAAQDTDVSSLFSSDQCEYSKTAMPTAKAEQVRQWQQTVQTSISPSNSASRDEEEGFNVLEDITRDETRPATPSHQIEPPPAPESISPERQMETIRRPRVMKPTSMPESLNKSINTEHSSFNGNGSTLEAAGGPLLRPDYYHLQGQEAENAHLFNTMTEPTSSHQADLCLLMQDHLTPSQLFDGLRPPLDSLQPKVASRNEKSSPSSTIGALVDLPGSPVTRCSGQETPSPTFVSSTIVKAYDVQAGSLIDQFDDGGSSGSMPHIPALPPSSSGLGLASRTLSETNPKEQTAQVQLRADNQQIMNDKAAEGGSNAGRPENMQSTRSVKSTPSGKGASLKGKADKVRLDKLNEIGVSLLGLARPFNGDVRLSVEIGRILLSGMATQYTDSPFTETEWDNAFTGKASGGMPKAIFTNMLTTSFIDADFILSLKLPGGARLFAEQPHEFKVAYEFVCLTEGAREIILEVDEFANYEVNQPTDILASLYWHYPKRTWDAVLTLTGATRVIDFCEDAARIVVENLQIPEQTLLDLRTKVPGKDLRVQKVMLRRETRYMAIAHPDIVLHLAEVQQLFIERNNEDEIRAFATTATEMAKDSRLWYEVSLSSKFATEKLYENLELELGEKAEWEPREFIDRGVLEDLKLVAAKLVVSLDGIGLANEGSRTEADEQSIRQALGAPKPLGFW